MTQHAAGDRTLMAVEIAEQPTAVERTLAALLPMRAELARLAGDRRHVLLVGRGSSDNAAVYGRYLLETRAGVSAALAAPSVATHYRAERDLSDTVVVAISQSGETEEMVVTLQWARARGAATVAVTNAAGSALAQQADLALVTHAGQERSVPATKSYTTQLVAMAVLTTALSARPESLDDELHRVPDEQRALLSDQDGVAAAVEALAHGWSASAPTLALGRGLVMGTALELGLKLEETCLRPVRGLSYADLRHGPIAVVAPEATALLVAAADGPLVESMAGLAADLHELGATVVGFGGDERLHRHCDVRVAGPRLSEPVAPLGLVVPAQLMVEALARRAGLDPDAPRGLSKVTQTDRGHENIETHRR